MQHYSENATAGVLQGVRVLALSRLVAGDVLTGVLGDYGADVVKVEPAAGDPLRAWRVEGVETSWKLFGRNKRSLALDFRHAESRDLLLKLASSAQVWVESFRPDALEEMGVGPEELLAANEKLIVVRISGWGQDGPYQRRPGFGSLGEGMSGLASMNGFPDREPLLPPAYLADSVAGLYGAATLLAALREVEVNGGRGQVIDLPLFDPLFTILGPHAANLRLTGNGRERSGSQSSDASPRNVYRTRDDLWLALSASTQGMAQRLFEVIGRPELNSDPRFINNVEWLNHNDEVDEIVGGFIAGMTQAEALAFFEAAAVKVGPIYDVSQIIEDPHMKARGLVQDYQDEAMEAFPMHALAGATLRNARQHAPAVANAERAGTAGADRGRP